MTYEAVGRTGNLDNMSKNTADIKSRKKQFSPKGSQPTRSQDDEDEDESFQEKVRHRYVETEKTLVPLSIR